MKNTFYPFYSTEYFSTKLSEDEIMNKVDSWLTKTKTDFAIKLSLPWGHSNPKYHGEWLQKNEFSLMRNKFITNAYVNPFKPRIIGVILDSNKSAQVFLEFRLCDIGIVVAVGFILASIVISIGSVNGFSFGNATLVAFISLLIFGLYYFEYKVSKNFIVKELQLRKPPGL